MSGSNQLEVVRAGALTRLVINRPDKANALDGSVIEDLLAAVAHAHEDGTRLLVIRGHGRNLSAGFDFSGFEDQSEAVLLWRFVRIEQLLQLLYHAPFATLAFAHGKNFGAGADLFIACDARVAAPEATFRMPGLAFGLQLGTRRLGARIGTENAHGMLAASMTIDARTATAWRFATDVAAIDQWPALEESTLASATRLSADARARLNRATRSDTCALDMADLVASVTAPGMKDRIRAYRSAS